MIEFEQIVMNNFLSFGKKQMVPLLGQGMVRIEGRNLDEPGSDSNQAGKSAIIEGLIWALFGKTVRGVRHDAVVNRFARRNCFVMARFSVDGIQYKVRRYRKHEKHSNKLKLWRGGTSLSSRKEEDTQQKLETVLGVDYQTFTNSILFGGVRPFASMTDADQKKILESILRFSQFDIALKKAKRLLSRTQDSVAAIREDISARKEEINGLREKVKALRRSVVVFKEGRDSTVRKLEKKISSFRAELPDRQPTYDSKEVEGLRSLEETGRKAVWDFAAQIKTQKEQLGKLKADLRNREGLLGKPCEACGQMITKKVLESYSEHVLRDRRRLKGRIAILRVRHKRLSETHCEFSRQLHELEHRQAGWDRRTQVRKTVLASIVTTEVELTEAKSDRSPFEEEISSESAKYSRAMSRMYVLQQEEYFLKKRIKDLQFWEVGFGNRGIKSMVVREALPVMNRKLSEFSEEVLGGSGKIEFVPSKQTKKGDKRELFHVRYVARRGADSYTGESSGGRKRVDICILLVFAWMSRTCNLLLVDELLDSLDESGRECVLNVLSKLRGTILVISHSRGLKSRVGKVWTVTKRHGFSTIEER